MRPSLFAILLFFFCLQAIAQPVAELIPPAIQWQKCYGGTAGEAVAGLKRTSDGGYIFTTMSLSGDGDISTQYGSGDVWVVKLDATRNIQWQKSYGGSNVDIGTDIIQTSDGGYVFVGHTASHDGDIAGAHYGNNYFDVWVVKINSTGVLQWQHCMGGKWTDRALSVVEAHDGGIIVTCGTSSYDGDVIGFHGGTSSTEPTDAWLLKFDASGNYQWQKCYGGTGAESLGNILRQADGGYIAAGVTSSNDGDINCTGTGFSRWWLVKMDMNCNIQWQTCELRGASPTLRQTPDGGFIISGFAGYPAYPDDHGGGDGMLAKFDAAGFVQWRKCYGARGEEVISDIAVHPNGGYIAAGSTEYFREDLCSKGLEDIWVFKIDATGNIEWEKTYGGSNQESAPSIIVEPGGSSLIGASAQSNDGDGDINGGSHGSYDAWLFELDFPGIAVLPTVAIEADKTTICPGQTIRFIATSIMGGTAPSYQWQVNGINATTNNDTVYFNNLNDGDIVSCILTSNSRCVTEPTDESNTIAITVDQGLIPSDFLWDDTAICQFGTIELKPVGVFDSYLWNNNATTPSITISQPGSYWLEVTSGAGCPGRDTIVVRLKECLKGFFMPTAFTPNNDGKNDLMRPILLGNVQQYKFTIVNRWGQTIFETSDPSKGWDGRLKGILQDGNAFVWTCSYQLAGEEPKFAKGTFVLIR